MPQRCRIPKVKSPHASGSATASTSPAARVPADVCGNAPRRRPSAHVIARPMATTGWGSQRGSPKARSAANPAATARIVITGHRPPKRGRTSRRQRPSQVAAHAPPGSVCTSKYPIFGTASSGEQRFHGTRVNDEDGAPTPLGALRFARLPKHRDDAAGEIALALAMRAARLAPGVYPGAVARILFKLGGASPLEVAEIHLAQTGARHKLRVREEDARRLVGAGHAARDNTEHVTIARQVAQSALARARQ